MNTGESSNPRMWMCKDILLAEENRNILLKLVRYSLLMITLPLTAYYVGHDYFFAEMKANSRDSLSGILAVLAVNAVIAVYVYEAFVVEKVDAPNQNQYNRKTD
mmetsp:Transcript_4056/g.5603  ORF Transcript_4056/g.5603 Transcript_4056/m.5603 type:complete len:104 (-) Transcript_4056:46-357(-)